MASLMSQATTYQTRGLLGVWLVFIVYVLWLTLAGKTGGLGWLQHRSHAALWGEELWRVGGKLTDHLFNGST